MRRSRGNHPGRLRCHDTTFSVYDILRLVNADLGDWHGLAIVRSESDDVVVEPTTIRGVSERSFVLGTLSPGLYLVSCPITPTMNATLTVEWAAHGRWDPESIRALMAG